MKISAEIIIDFENARRYWKIAVNFINRNLSRIFRITKRLVFNIKHVHVPGFVTILTNTWFDKKIYGNKLVDQSIIEYLRTEFNAKALILVAADNDYAQVLQELKSRGVYIIVVGHTVARKLYEIADEYYVVDLSAIPEPAVIPVKQ